MRLFEMLKGVFSSVTQPDTKSSNVRNSVNTEENSLSGMKVVELKSKLNKSQLVDLLG